MTTTLVSLLEKKIQDVPNFPKEGVMFKDIMPLFLDPAAFQQTIRQLAELLVKYQPTHLVGMESRGFLFAAPLAYEMGIRFVPARKKGKLPGILVSQTYDLEYGTDTLEIQKAALDAAGRYVIVDDVLATGGTALAVNNLLRQENCEVVGNLFLIELAFLKGREKLLNEYLNLKVESCLTY